MELKKFGRFNFNSHGRVGKISLAIVFFLLILYAIFLKAPANFPTDKIVIIPLGVGVKSAGEILKDHNIINSPALFSIFSKILSRDSVRAGGYLFEQKENLFKVVNRLGKGDHRLLTLRITFPEGITASDAAKICQSSLPLCSQSEFIALASSSEGYLFPDTYFFLQSTEAEEVIDLMKATFTTRLATLQNDLKAFPRGIKEIITMASILEEEATTFEDRQKVARILWRRLNIGMPLQVDATLSYVLGRNTYELTALDLATSSPYNSYKKLGLPPTPISNPGLVSIKAALSNSPTPYLYYLTDRNGKFYFARTFDEHVRNKTLYLNVGR